MNFLDLGSGGGLECILAAHKKARISVGIEFSTKNISIVHGRAVDEAAICGEKTRRINWLDRDS